MTSPDYTSRTRPLEPVLAWIDAHRDDAIADLQRFCRQPSVAAQNWGMQEMAEIVEDALRSLGADTTMVPTAGYPVAVGHLKGEGERRLMIYNHYDVQPPDPLDAWISPPFDAAIRDGHLYARGVADNKGNAVARMWAIRAWQAVYGTLPCPVTFILEGEEEIGSIHLAEFAATHQELIRGDACLWETGYREDDGAMTIYAGAKGILYIELRVQTVAYDLHSSQAPLAPNAAWRLIEALHTIRDFSGHVHIPHFYDDVVPPTAAERELMERFPINTTALQQAWGVDQLLVNSKGTPTERLLLEPTCNICGFWSGYSGQGSKTILPATAGVKIDFRLVPQQDPEKILASLRQYLRDQGFSDIEVIEVEDAEKPAQSPVDTPLLQALINSARTIYGIEPYVRPRTPGTGPIEQLCQRYGVPAIGGAGVGHPLSRIHSPNENIKLADFVLGIKHVAALLAEFADA